MSSNLENSSKAFTLQWNAPGLGAGSSQGDNLADMVRFIDFMRNQGCRDMVLHIAPLEQEQ